MKIEVKELELKNKYLASFNEGEASVARSLSKMKRCTNLIIPNIETHIKSKSQEIEEIFYSKEIKCYSESVLGNIIFLYLRIKEKEGSEILEKIFKHEQAQLPKKALFKRKNPYIDKYNEIIRMIDNFKLDDKLIDNLYINELKAEIKSLIPYIEDDLIKLKGYEYSNFCINRLKELIEKEEKDVKKKRLML